MSPSLAGGTTMKQDAARDRKTRRIRFIIASLVVVAILVVLGVSLIINAAPFRRAVILVDETSIKMDYFLKRTRLAGASPLKMLEVLTNEMIINEAAPKLVGRISRQDVDRELSRIADNGGETLSEIEFKAWYRQLLNEAGLSDSDYREMITTNLLAGRLYEYLAARMPTVSEQVRLNAIVLTREEMENLRMKSRDGADVHGDIQAIWQKRRSEGTVEDLGWIPRQVLLYGLDEVAFSTGIGEVSAPIAYLSDDGSEENVYYSIQVLEKAAAREIDEASLQVLRSQALDDWLLEQQDLHNVIWRGLKNGFDSETLAWINWRLAKMAK